MNTAKANMAAAHKLARIVYFMLTCGETFVDRRQQRYEEQQRERFVVVLKRHAALLGLSLTSAAGPPHAATI